MNITILGTGFAALTAIKNARKKAPNAHITVIAPQQKMIYLPSLIWIPSGLKKGSDLEIDLTNFFKKQSVKFIKATVQNIINDGRTVVTDQGEFNNDGLIIATGGRFIKKLPGIEHVITPCEGISAAEKIKDKLENLSSGTIAIGFSGNPKEPRRSFSGIFMRAISFLGNPAPLRPGLLSSNIDGSKQPPRAHRAWQKLICFPPTPVRPPPLAHLYFLSCATQSCK